MLNISENPIPEKPSNSDFDCFQRVETAEFHKRNAYVILAISAFFSIFLFLPWTQNIRSSGKVTTLRPEQRPQKVMSPIAGRVERWHVREGDFVKKGDTLVEISEIKEKYLDPQLVERTEEQLMAKEFSMESYNEKIKALDNQIQALQKLRGLKLEQATNKKEQAELKVQQDSLTLEAKRTDYNIAIKQFERMEKMYEDGVRTKVDQERRKLKLQETEAAFLGTQAKLLGSRNELLNAIIEINNIESEFQDKLSKAQSEKFSALSLKLNAESEVAKLRNKRQNFINRRKMYFITAPQSGYATEALTVGIGETVKEGTPFLSIMPENYQLAVSSFVQPIDLPLLELGQRVRIQFDGWPAIVFSGWENISYGTYAGRIVAIDNFANQNGQYRILIAPDPDDHPWPEPLRPGGGAITLTLLNDVPLWYEIWRQFNGFPPDFYNMEPQEKVDKIPLPK
ncbi:MAG: HlyD family efflux transporter periplasmic adaptor subunit [Bacteroidetes bacterium]|jgi:multidrug resistance efflux pump|nr:HlyD family efflux transporter periplasmic adaptor subunit [Bacteroidota bacterium]